ncbi:MAG: diguanylate cyclase (GGDEF)-like protein/PAS domain S-box-containing protein [Candidatus Azotimanducaceae bacterium]|jgi:diguanylate cyclase (GGDEF)-like protein/PAS domain S-box-containing protein
MSAVMIEQGLERNILIVDDEPLQRESLKQMLELSGYQVETADSGEVAIGMLQNYSFDLLLLDLNMPGMGGFGVIDYVIEHEIPSKILVVSGDANFETAREALGKGAYDFVKKPYAPDELLTTIGNAASKKELEDANDTMRQKLSESEYLHRFIVDHSPDIVFMLDTDGRFTFLNDTVYQTLGFNKTELIGQHYSKIVSNQSKDQAKYVFTERRSDDRKSSNVELKLKCRGESEYRYFDMTSMAIMLQESNHGDASYQGTYQGTYGVARDVTEKKNAQELINFQAYHDLLTKLPNRALMEDRLGIAITQARRNKQSLAVMFLDLDRFKWVNDTMGHAMGDRLLQAVGQRLENMLRKGDTLARFGGDEFALILPQITRAEDAGTIAEKILGELKDPFKLDEHELHVSGSIGIAVYPEAGSTMESLIKSADMAMYCVKDRGKNGYEFYTESMNEISTSRLTIERDLRKALANDQLRVCYQPQVNATTEKIVGFEALVRWQHAENGLIFPDEFIPVAEETGLIVDVGNFVLETACRDLAVWRSDGVEQIRVSINFSALQVEQDDFIERIVDTLRRHNLPGDCLEVEITESIIMNDMSQVVQKLRKLTSLGIKIAIDDFGTGYSSLSYLQQFPINTLKIDKSFVGSINVNQGATSIVDAIVAMAHGLKLNLIAEGVETEPQLEYLKSLGCAEIQGWLFGKAESAEMTSEMLDRIRHGGCIRGDVAA